MKFNSLKFFFLFSVIVLLSSCLGTSDDTTTVSTNASFKSLTFASNDSSPNLKNAVFTKEYDAVLKDSVIVNLDSLPYGSRIDSVNPTFAFKSTAGAKLYFEKGARLYYTPGTTTKADSTYITGTDTVDFRLPVKVTNWASDGIAHKSYIIKVNVHKVKPALYVWRNQIEKLDVDNAINQKAIVFNDIIYYYMNNGSEAYYYSSADGKTWSSKKTAVGLPVNTPLNDMVEYNGKLYVSQNGNQIYASSDGENWTKFVSDYVFKSFLYSFNGKLWAVVEDKTNSNICRFLTYDGTTWVVRGEIPANFPVRDFASLSFASRTGIPKVLLVSGYDKDNNILKNRWSSEDGTYWVNFTEVRHDRTLDTMAVGASVILYDSKLFIFGVRTDSVKPTVHFKQSLDEGLSWQTPDTTYNKLIQVDTTKTRIKWPARSYSSAVVLKPRNYIEDDNLSLVKASNWIFVIGGKMGSTTYSDVWSGKLNRKNFLLQ